MSLLQISRLQVGRERIQPGLLQVITGQIGGIAAARNKGFNASCRAAAYDKGRDAGTPCRIPPTIHPAHHSTR